MQFWQIEKLFTQNYLRTQICKERGKGRKQVRETEGVWEEEAGKEELHRTANLLLSLDFGVMDNHSWPHPLPSPRGVV